MTSRTFSEAEVFEITKNVILSAQLPPGTKLPETRIAPLFGITRERLRKVFHRLGNDQLLDVKTNRGTAIPVPSLELARELFEARRTLEVGIGIRLAERLNKVDIARLREHLELEKKVASEQARPDFIVTSSNFHILLSELLNNSLITKQLEALIAKSALFSTFHDPNNVSACACAEHQLIVDALENGSIADVCHAIVSHLSLIETRLTLTTRSFEKADPEVVFSEFIQKYAQPAL